MHPFVNGREYGRSELLAFVGSRQQQTGVIWGNVEPDCTIVTSGGRHGLKAGYFDEKAVDGTWRYFGQGRSGDHLSSNAANKRLLSGRGTVLLFLTREPTSAEIKLKGNYRKRFIFQGAFNVCGYDVVTPDTGPRTGDKLLCFRLVPVLQGWVIEDIPMPSTQTDIFALRRRLSVPYGRQKDGSARSVALYVQRSQEVRRYALLRSRGRCEACDAPAPFLNDRGVAFLEVHHINRLADDGVDEPENVAAVCPNCHRRAHYSADRARFKGTLVSAVRAAESRVAEAALGSSETHSRLPGGKRKNTHPSSP